MKEKTVTTTDGTFRVRVDQDEDADSPRDVDNIGTMVLAHRKYDLPHEGDHAKRIDHVFSTYPTGPAYRIVSQWLRVFHGATVVLPVWGYDHSDFLIKAGDRTHPFDDMWDSGFLGIIYDTPESCPAPGYMPHRDLTEDERAAYAAGQLPGAVMMGGDPDRLMVPRDMADVLSREVASYDAWSRGEIYRYVIEQRVQLYRRGHDGTLHEYSHTWEEIEDGSAGGYTDPDEALADGLAEVPGEPITEKGADSE